MNTHYKLKKAAKETAKAKTATVKIAPKSLSAEDLPDVPIYFQTWIKYFNFRKKSPSEPSKKPKYFFKNEAFGKQSLAKDDTKDLYGDFKIPNESSFFAVIYEDKINILSSRETAFNKIIDSLPISLIYSIPEENHFQGGVLELPRFSEGYCFEVRTREPLDFFQISQKEPIPEKGVDKTWYLCSESEEIKNKLMHLVIKLRIKMQHKVGLYISKNVKTEKLSVSSLISTPTDSSVKPSKSALKNPIDGYWVILQDWTTCSKLCGGGFQYQHLQCIPPQNGGNPCEGDALRSRPCNEYPCPLPENSQGLLPIGKQRSNKAIIRMLPISSRPLRYDKCHLKEGDAIYTAQKGSVGILQNPERLPVRIVMNDKTVSVFTNENLETLLATFVIDKTKFMSSSRDSSCFILDSETTKGEFCRITNENLQNFYEEWNYDFSLFKVQCRTSKDVVELNLKEEKELQDELDKKIEKVKMDVITERTKKIQKLAHETPANKVDKLQETAMLAMKKELSIDGLLQKEEMEREEAENKILKDQIEAEKKKDECLIKSLKERELEDQYNLTKVQQDKELNELKEQAKRQILMKRKQMKMKILQMRKRASRKKKIYQDELTALRAQVAGELNRHNKEGNENLCFKPSNSDDDKKKVLNYCNTNFADGSANKMNECLLEESFCFVCCENEFGEIHVQSREKCYNKCDEIANIAPKAGSWQWTENTLA